MGASFCRSATAASTNSLWHARPTMPSVPEASTPDRSRCWFWWRPSPLHIPLWSLRGETGDRQLVCHCLQPVSTREHSLLLAFGCLNKSSVLVKYLKRTIKMVEGFMQNVWILSWGIWSGKEQKLFFLSWWWLLAFTEWVLQSFFLVHGLKHPHSKFHSHQKHPLSTCTKQDFCTVWKGAWLTGALLFH